MDMEKIPVLEDGIPVTERSKAYSARKAKPPTDKRQLGTLFITLAVCCWCWYMIFNPWTGLSKRKTIHCTQDAPVISTKTPVPLEAHIMSKCPDSKVCLKELILPTMQRVASKVNFTLSYIGTPTANDGVECLHGASECMGNIIELCAHKLYPEPRIYLGFVMCLTRDYEDIPDEDLVKDCALEHGLDFARLNECSSADDGSAIGMLRGSVERSREVGATTSCTVRLNDEVYCVHDGEWKDCPTGPGVNDLVVAIEKLYNSS